jgi:hypothetical protein
MKPSILAAVDHTRCTPGAPCCGGDPDVAVQMREDSTRNLVQYLMVPHEVTYMAHPNSPTVMRRIDPMPPDEIAELFGYLRKNSTPDQLSFYGLSE